MKTFFTAIACICISLAADAQRNYQDANYIGITVGVNQTSLDTQNFKVKAATGWNAGLSVRGNFYNNFDMVYGMQFSENIFDVSTTNALAMRQDVAYKLSSAQIYLMPSYKIAGNHLSIEVGPVVQVNGKLKLNDAYHNNIIDGTTLRAIDIVDVNTFNFLGAVGLTAGFTNVRVNLQYKYGINNFLGNLNDQGLAMNFNGHLGIASANIIVYF